MAGIGGIRPETRDVSRRRDRQTAWVLVVAAAVSAVLFYPLGIVVALVAAAYAHGSGADTARTVALLLLVGILLLLLLGVGGGFDGGALG